MKKHLNNKILFILFIILILFFLEFRFLVVYSTPNQSLGSSIGSAGNGLCRISGNVREYISDTENTNIENIKIELLDNDENKIQLYDPTGTPIDCLYSDANGNYQITGLETPSVGIDENDNTTIKEKEYIVQFTYGTEQQLKINPKYNGQDYQTPSTKNISPSISSNSKDPLQELNEIQKNESEIEKIYNQPQKLDIIFILDRSGSMKTVVEKTKKSLKITAEKLFDKYGDNVQIGLLTNGGRIGPDGLCHYYRNP